MCPFHHTLISACGCPQLRPPSSVASLALPPLCLCRAALSTPEGAAPHWALPVGTRAMSARSNTHTHTHTHTQHARRQHAMGRDFKVIICDEILCERVPTSGKEIDVGMRAVYRPSS
eukprot:2090200-Rhodomonas_salina.1